MFEGSKEVGPHSQISSKRLDHIHKSHPRGWTTFTTLIQEVGPHSQISSKRLDHIHNSHPRGWTTLTNLIQEYSFMFGVEIMTIWTKVDATILALFFDKCAHEVVEHLSF